MWAWRRALAYVLLGVALAIVVRVDWSSPPYPVGAVEPDRTKDLPPEAVVRALVNPAHQPDLPALAPGGAAPAHS